MRAIFFATFILFSSNYLVAQSIFDSATCGGINKLSGYGADRIFTKSREWVKINLQPISYTENETAGTLLITCFEDYDAKTVDKLPRRFSGKFEYTFIVTVREGYYSYSFVNVKYIPKRQLKYALQNPEGNDGRTLRIKKKTWEKITRSAFKQLMNKGRKYDSFMQAC